MAEASYLWLIPLLPLLGFVLCGTLHLAVVRARAGRPDESAPLALSGLAPLVACLAMAGSFAVSLMAFLRLRAAPEPLLESPAFEWIVAGPLRVDVGLVFDPLAAVMALVVCGVGLLIHVYSVGYMKGDPGYAKFFAFMTWAGKAWACARTCSSAFGTTRAGRRRRGRRPSWSTASATRASWSAASCWCELFGTLDISEIGAWELARATGGARCDAS